MSTDYPNYLESISNLETAKTALTLAEVGLINSTKDHLASIDLAAEVAEPSKTALQKCADTLTLRTINARRVELAKERIKGREIEAEVALDLACEVTKMRLQKWTTDFSTAQINRVLEGQEITASRYQTAQKIVSESDLVIRATQLALGLSNGIKNVFVNQNLKRAIDFLEVNEKPILKAKKRKALK
jgi:hypothetical protein